MKISARLDVEVVAHEADDEITLLLGLEAPGAPRPGKAGAGTSPQTLEGSRAMSGEPPAKAAQAGSLTVHLQPPVEMLRLDGELPAVQTGPDAVTFELGDFDHEEQRTLLIRFHVPAMAALGRTRVASLELRYLELPSLVEQIVILPVTVDVVPRDQAAGRVADPVVRTEALFREAQLSRRLASEALERGERVTARQLLDCAVEMLRDAGDAAPESLRDEVLREAADVEALGAHVLLRDASHSPKATRASRFPRQHRQRHQRGCGPSQPEGS